MEKINNSFVIGADVGGTHITAALVDVQQRAIIDDSLVRKKVDAHSSLESIIAIWVRAIQEASRGVPFDALGLAMPGPFDYENGISLMRGQGKYENLYGLPVKTLLAKCLSFPVEHIYMVNDAASFLQGEVFVGAANGFKNAIGVTLGTGLGSAFFRNEEVKEAGLWKKPFREGIAEDYLCTRWFIRRYLELTGDKLKGVSELLTKMSDNPFAQQLFDEFGENLGLFLTHFININSPEVVVIGGNIAKSFRFFEKSLREVLKDNFPATVIKIAQLGEEAALLGAACHGNSNIQMNIS